MLPYSLNRFKPTSHGEIFLLWSLTQLLLFAEVGCFFYRRLRASKKAHLFFDFIFSGKIFAIHTVGVILQSILTVTQLSRNMLHCFFTVQQIDFSVRRRIVIQWRTRNQIRNQTAHQNFHSRKDFDLKTVVNEKKHIVSVFESKVLQFVRFRLWYIANCQFLKFFTKFPIGRKTRTRKTTFWFVSLPKNVQLSFLSAF